MAGTIRMRQLAESAMKTSPAESTATPWVRRVGWQGGKPDFRRTGDASPSERGRLV